jgi:ABC-type multidrug transport system permease subunit
MRTVLYRERAAGTYGPLAYPLALLAAELPWSAFYSLLFCAINYFLVGFRAEAGPFFTATLAVFMCAVWFHTLGAGFIAFFPVALLAQIAGGPTIQISILFAGVNLSRSQLPEGWRWLYDADGFAHALRLFFLPQYAGDSSSIADLSQGGKPFKEGEKEGKQAFTESRLGTTADSLWAELGYLAAIVGAAMVLMTLFYARCNHQRR